MDEPMLDAFCERLRQKLYLHGSEILYHGGPVEKMIFIVRESREHWSIRNQSSLSEGDVCGEELLKWYLEHPQLIKDGGKVRFPGQKLYSTRTVRCLTNVEAFALRAADLEDVTKHFSRFLRNPRVQGAISQRSRRRLYLKVVYLICCLPNPKTALQTYGTKALITSEAAVSGETTLHAGWPVGPETEGPPDLTVGREDGRGLEKDEVNQKLHDNEGSRLQQNRAPPAGSAPPPWPACSIV
ncbi:hypothetical protein HPP92_024451 [Vanilla planifolia]|uniref:Cyclic nucleotide-binding domain-containing protein n=1 Tax=Vanilla planifolia TaxID=51239 RepID=A0A835PSU2_VANPL|nr:hypothetical protein HPP92_024451 [Vanilla planifolia]